MRRTVFVFSLFAGAAGAQGNLSTQGYGFPTGQFSARAAGTGGAVAEIDPWSPLNPSTIGVFSSKVLFFQIEPEYRTVQNGAAKDRTTTSRYPVLFGAAPVGSRWVVSIGASTLLDRTASTVVQSTKLVGTDSVQATTTFTVDGAMNDVRLATAFTPASWIRLGVGAHAITGRSFVSVGDVYGDTTAFSNFTVRRTLSYGGAAASAGVQLISRNFVAAASARTGGTLTVSESDTLLSSGRVPTRFGLSVAYTGIANSAIAFRTSREGWSSLNKLGPGVSASDAWDTSVGADVAGLKLIGQDVAVRAGARTRTLPFAAAGKTVTENSFSGGLGTMFAGGRLITDVGLTRASRDAGLAANERAWILSLGIGVRP